MEKLQLMALDAVRREPSLELAAEVLSSYIEDLEYRLTEGVLELKKSLEGRVIKPVDLRPAAKEAAKECQECSDPVVDISDVVTPEIQGVPLPPDMASLEDKAAISRAVLKATHAGKVRDVLLLLANYPRGVTIPQMMTVAGDAGKDYRTWWAPMTRYIRSGAIRKIRPILGRKAIYVLSYWDNPRPSFWVGSKPATAITKTPRVRHLKIGSLGEGMVVALRADGVSFIEIVKDYANDNGIDWKVSRPKIMSIITKHRAHIETLQSLPPGQPRFDYLSKWFEGWGTHDSSASSA